MSAPYAAGALYSTVEDLYKWDQALYSDRLLTKTNLELIFKPYLENYAYGWHVSKAPIGEADAVVTVVSHNGGINGFNTRIVRFIEDKHLIVILRNAPGASINQMTEKMAAILYNRPYDLPKKSAAEAIAKTMLETNIQAGLMQYKNLKQKQSEEYEFDERSFNRVGYQLIGLKRLQEAIEIFKLNMQAYPQSANTYDSLAEGYMLMGDTESAIKYYEKTLEMIPDDSKLNEQSKVDFKNNVMKKLGQLRVSKK